ncbi:MAG: AMP-binding protein [Isosphaeraceae bacterium]|nr:AMP-binding protein [Isosphaeraceae bacterium]
MSVSTGARTNESTVVEPGGPLSPLPLGWQSLAGAFLRAVRATPGKLAMADSSGAKLTYSEVLLRSLVLGRVLERSLGPEPYVGLLLPPAVPSAVANVALTLWGKIPVNLNYTASQKLIDASIEQCGITHVVTSRRALEKLKLSPKGTLLYLEDVPKQVKVTDKLFAAALAKLAPEGLLRSILPGLREDRLDKTATVIFTSGSTGDPKGVVLSHRNVLSNVHQMDEHLDLLPDEMVLGILPYFHSFGFTVAIWTVLCLSRTVVYHNNPLDARHVGDLCEKYGVTMLVGTPTFMRLYLQKCKPEQFSKMVHLFLGAEKLKPELAASIRQTLGIDPMEGYGCTELSPVVAVNQRGEKTTLDGRKVDGNRLGTAGTPLPGTQIQTRDPETGEPLPSEVEGMIHVRGPQVMVGYLNRPDLSASVLRDGWYCTGDLGFVDADGFLSITGRLSRFSKIGGEMVPHEGLEAAIIKAIGVTEQNVAVTSLPDPKRGERLIVVHTALGVASEDVCHKLNEARIPKLWIPAPDSFVEVESLPILGTGKLDLRGLRQIAEERIGQ